MSIPIALQIYSVRQDAEKDLFGVLKEVARMGYAGVEFAGYYGHDAAEIRKVLDDLGLKAEGTHTGIHELSDDRIGATIDVHHALGANFVIVPWLPEDARNSVDACKATGDKLTAISEKLRGAGLRAGFHAHEGDMHPIDGGKSAWYLLADATPADFIMQYDTSNGMAGGADPVQPILDLPGRSASVHLKEANDLIIGEGPIPWDGVFKASEGVGGVEWYVVEHEAPTGNAMQSVELCLASLRRMGK
ncbi:sugar phosphate isomerase/epimerase family protein [Fimbriimonas ginsengisoli]|uniref:Xylose isomerase domain-containing protein n=1 Tax=Fimbriimonas ginsengisoli Gsoil 348 TaxID=661478 RepID=A0A068NQG8_FIMGI|nr:sugar phosphate isomerase/epimerase [Fimbriimonas ginsengisoli]AIE83854.1 xylose isomerase domain-containing protein [Fimbriimonas ginsengisoli Gsoil 348]